MEKRNYTYGEKQFLIENMVRLFLSYYCSAIGFNYEGNTLYITKKSDIFKRKFLDKYIDILTNDIKNFLNSFSKQEVFENWRFLTHRIIQGNIESKNNNKYIVSFHYKNIIGVLFDSLSLKKDNYRVGKSYWFYIHHVSFDAYTDYPVKLILDRKTNMLPVCLLKKEYPSGKFKCKKYSGQKSVIYSNVLVSKKNIQMIRNAVGEKIILKKL